MSEMTFAEGNIGSGGTFKIVAYSWAVKPNELRYDVYFDGMLKIQNCDSIYAIAILQHRMIEAAGMLRPSEI